MHYYTNEADIEKIGNRECSGCGDNIKEELKALHEVPDEWETLKQNGSSHYKTSGGIEPVDLYRAGNMFQAFALCSIIKYAFRQRDNLNVRDLDKIIDYAEKLKATLSEGK